MGAVDTASQRLLGPPIALSWGTNVTSSWSCQWVMVKSTSCARLEANKAKWSPEEPATDSQSVSVKLVQHNKYCPLYFDLFFIPFLRIKQDAILFGYDGDARIKFGVILILKQIERNGFV